MVSSGMPPILEPKLAILPPEQRRLWPELQGIPRGFVLYGGTAIALHLGHRQSVDFDFFAFEDISSSLLLDTIPALDDARVVQQSPNTLTVIVDRSGPVQLSFFGLPRLRPVREPWLVEENGLEVAAPLDLAGTKAAVVQQRAEAKDYLDIAALIEHAGISLAEALSAAASIYGPSFNPQLTLKALCYFDDGNLPSLPARTRRQLIEAVRSVDLDDLPAVGVGNPPSPGAAGR
jgi:hypothetical protein